MFRIVIVEDEATVRRGLVMTTPWKDYDCKVIGEAENGKEGLDLILRLKPDIIITDIKMPKMSGIEMMECVLEKQDAVFIVLTAFNEFEYAQHAIKLGAVDYLLKPFSDEQFETAIRRAKQSVKNLQIVAGHQSTHQNEMIESIDKYLSTSNNSKHEKLIGVMEFIRSNYQKDISISDTADYFNVSESYLSRLFREETDYSFHEYLTVYRIRKACEMLMDTSVRIYEVAQSVGYKDQRYFSIVFKKYMGMSPGHFKEKLPK